MVRSVRLRSRAFPKFLFPSQWFSEKIASRDEAYMISLSARLASRSMSFVFQGMAPQPDGGRKKNIRQFRAYRLRVVTGRKASLVAWRAPSSPCSGALFP